MSGLYLKARTMAVGPTMYNQIIREMFAEFRTLLLDSSLPNLFSRCGQALQVDGNFGAAAAIAEMLLQSHDGKIRFLPALPSEWTQGSVSGLRARGGFTVSMAWTEGSLTEVTIDAAVDGPCRIAAEGVSAVLHDGRPIPVTQANDGSLEFEVDAGSSYRLTIER